MPHPYGCSGRAERPRRSVVSTFFAVLAISALSSTVAHAVPPMGPLRACPDNGRYFCNPAGKAVFLAGSHTWNNLVDMGANHPPPSFDFDAYLDFLEAHHHNVVRLWAWEVAQPEDWFDTPLRIVATPLVWSRTGPGLALDGRPRFDLSQLDTEYFERLRQRISRARERGFYVIVMLFEGWSVQLSPGRNTHPFHPDNNINGTEFLTNVEDIHTLKHPEILALQDRYVEEVVRTIAGMDHILFEIVNEAGVYSTAWQYRMIDHVRSLLSSQGDHAPVGMSSQYSTAGNVPLFDSNADWISPGSLPGFYRTNPTKAGADKVLIADTDHLAGSSLQEHIWAYKSLLRGLNLLYMDRYHGPTSVSSEHLHAAAGIRTSLGVSRLIADLVDIGAAQPDPTLASSGYALSADDWLLVLAPSRERLELDLRHYEGQLLAEWLETERLRFSDAGIFEGGDLVGIYPPSREGALLYLRKQGSAAPPLSSIANEARAIREASLKYADFTTWLRLRVTPWLSAAGSNHPNLVKTLFAAGLAGLLSGLFIALAACRFYGASERDLSTRSSHISRQ